MNSRIEVVPIELHDGSVIHSEVCVLGGEEDVRFKTLPFHDAIQAVSKIADSMHSALEQIKPDKAAVEFSLQLSVKEGKLTTLLVSGAATATAKIRLEWESRSSSED